MQYKLGCIVDILSDEDEENAENRPIVFSHAVSGLRMECVYDFMGRRRERVVYIGTEKVYHLRYAYRGYTQIAEFSITQSGDTEVQTLVNTTFWDPIEPTATRPLMMKEANGTYYYYTHDLTKNVCELLAEDKTIATTYDYTPFGAVTASNANTSNRFMFSSEVLDPETSLVYYNFRHYNPTDGRWISRDPLGEEDAWHLYAMLANSGINSLDWNGLWDKVNKEDANDFRYCAETGDTLRSLALKISGSEEDWTCLWPTDGTQDNGYLQGNVNIKDIYDASNLEKKWNSKYWYTVDDAFVNMGGVYNVTFSKIEASLVPAFIQKESGEGATPIQELLIDGHGSSSLLGISGKIGGKSSRFTLNDILKLDEKPTFKRAQAKQGPLRCWFSRTATIRFSACNTRNAAYAWSQKVLRKGAKAWGTRHTIYMANADFGGQYLYYKDKSGKKISTGRGAGIHSKTWIAFNGGL